MAWMETDYSKYTHFAFSMEEKMAAGAFGRTRNYGWEGPFKVVHLSRISFNSILLIKYPVSHFLADLTRLDRTRLGGSMRSTSGGAVSTNHHTVRDGLRLIGRTKFPQRVCNPAMLLSTNASFPMHLFAPSGPSILKPSSHLSFCQVYFWGELASPWLGNVLLVCEFFFHSLKLRLWK